MIYKGYQHRDISIDNILFSEEPSKKQIFDDELRNMPMQDEICKLVEELGMGEECHGCIIDGDLAVKLGDNGSEDNRCLSVCHLSFWTPTTIFIYPPPPL
jgi:serine/threonine protein kinase